MREGTGHFRSTDHVHIERIEQSWISGDRFRELLAGLHILTDVLENLLELDVVRLVCDSFQRLANADSSANMTASWQVKSSTSLEEGPELQLITWPIFFRTSPDPDP
jgi:hypothetical protein